jgi:ribose 5-phosphate isomerase B
MKIAVGSDHRGKELREYIASVLKNKGYGIIDVGYRGSGSCDYPDYARKVVRVIQSGKVERGILICGTGIGMSISANKYSGIRAALVSNEKMAYFAARHNFANVLCLGSTTGPSAAVRIIKTWLETPFEGGRHKRRVDKISRMEKERAR